MADQRARLEAQAAKAIARVKAEAADMVVKVKEEFEEKTGIYAQARDEAEEKLKLRLRRKPGSTPKPWKKLKRQ